MYKRLIFKEIFKRLQEPRRFIQVLLGPRQVGKTTLALQAASELAEPVHFASADEPQLKDRVWLLQQHDLALLKIKQANAISGILIIDEIQKIPQWSETIKFLWDTDTRQNNPLKIMLLGSSPLLMQQGLTESLAGRFEVNFITHWSYQEMHDAFNYTWEEYCYFGGYPGAASLKEDEPRWRDYIQTALIETTLSRDILLMTRIDKPALLRRLFYLGCEYSGQILSYQKMLGQLQDAGNTTTLAHYLQLLSDVGLLTGLAKYAEQGVRKKGSSPKFQVQNTALSTVTKSTTFQNLRNIPEEWGRAVETMIGAYCLNEARRNQGTVYYWRERNKEVDFVLEFANHRKLAIEVKSGKRQESFSGASVFLSQFPNSHFLCVGAGGMSMESFLQSTWQDWEKLTTY
jgi:predicted AAA+ superfamily ATPase